MSTSTLHLGIFYMPQIYDMGPTALLPLRRKACWGFFSPIKNPTASAGFEPANLGTKGQHATPRPPKPLILLYRGEFFKLHYDNKYFKSTSAKDSFYTNKLKTRSFELWHSWHKWSIYVSGISISVVRTDKKTGDSCFVTSKFSLICECLENWYKLKWTYN